jgi:hypothetical protein
LDPISIAGLAPSLWVVVLRNLVLVAMVWMSVRAIARVEQSP